MGRPILAAAAFQPASGFSEPNRGADPQVRGRRPRRPCSGGISPLGARCARFPIQLMDRAANRSEPLRRVCKHPRKRDYLLCC